MITHRARAAVVALGAALGATFAAAPSAQAQTAYVRSSSSGSSNASLSLIGLGLLGGGLLTAAPGIALLAVCKEGNPCHSDATTAAGWILAGPGIPPIFIGIFLLYLDKGSRSTLYNAPGTPGTPRPSPFRITAGPLPSGGMVGASYAF